jgi:hypothetical protein
MPYDQCLSAKERLFNANIRLMARDTVDESTSEKRPLVAVGYGPRCVPVMQLTEAAADVCELLWMIDGSLPEMREMTELLNRFGPVVNIAGLGVDQILQELSPPYRPDGVVTYLDANMPTFAQVAEALGLPFHSPATSVALTDKAEQRRVLRSRSRGAVVCVIIPESSPKVGFSDTRIQGRMARRLEAAFGSGQSLHLLRGGRTIASSSCFEDLGPERPDMVLESYLADDPRERRTVRRLRLGRERGGARRDQPPGGHRSLSHLRKTFARPASSYRPP